MQPLIVPEQATELGQWTERRLDVSGVSWDVNRMGVETIQQSVHGVTIWAPMIASLATTT
jgi:hypothetical protein